MDGFKFQVNNRPGQSPEILLYGVIGDPVEGVTAKQFRSALDPLMAAREITIRINSEGGLTGDGLAIYESIKRFPGRKIVEIDGIALSAASFIALAGDEIRIAQNAMMMIHNPWDVIAGDAGLMRKKADQLDKWKSGVVSIYTGKTGMSRDEIARLMDAETWFDSDESVRMGFADSVSGTMAVAAKFDMSKFHNVPEMAFKLAGVKRPHYQRYAIETEALRQQISSNN